MVKSVLNKFRESSTPELPELAPTERDFHLFLQSFQSCEDVVIDVQHPKFGKYMIRFNGPKVPPPATEEEEVPSMLPPTHLPPVKGAAGRPPPPLNPSSFQDFEKQFIKKPLPPQPGVSHQPAHPVAKP